MTGGSALGHPQEQAEDELREAVPWSPLLLRQEHHPQDGWQTLRLPFRLRPAELVRVNCTYTRVARERNARSAVLFS